jgi:hypothetical protein
MGLPAGVVRERIENAESGRSEFQRDQTVVAGSALASGSAPLSSAATSSSFPGFASSFRKLSVLLRLRLAGLDRARESRPRGDTRQPSLDAHPWRGRSA